MNRRKNKSETERKNDSFSVKDLMGNFIQENNLTKGFEKIHIKEAWAAIMAPSVMAYTNELRVQNGTLIVHLSSSALREQLGYSKEKIVESLNKELGEVLVKRIMLV